MSMNGLEFAAVVNKYLKKHPFPTHFCQNALSSFAKKGALPALTRNTSAFGGLKGFMLVK